MEEDFGAASRTTRLILAIRSRFTPYQEMARALPNEGRIVDLGCGWGLLSFALCRGSTDRQVLGVDHDPDRVQLAIRSAQRLPTKCRPEFQVRDVAQYLASMPAASCDGIAMIDMLHYFDGATQRSLVHNAARALRPGGVLVARDIDSSDGLKALINKLYERLATGIGFTKSTSVSLVFRGRQEWTQLFEEAGFSVRSEHSGTFFLADVLFIGMKKL